MILTMPELMIVNNAACCCRDEHILQKCGRDAVQYLTFQRYLLVYMAVITVLSIGVVLPCNFQGNLGRYNVDKLLFCILGVYVWRVGDSGRKTFSILVKVIIIICLLMHADILCCPILLYGVMLGIDYAYVNCTSDILKIVFVKTA